MQQLPFILVFLFGCMFSFPGYCQENQYSVADFEQLKINQIQTLGSHNSYHKRANKLVLNFLKGFNGIAPKDFKPKDLDYAHEPLYVQLDSFNLRSFEIDIYADPKGGQFYKRKKNNLLGKPKASKIEALKEPGFKVMHIPDIDYNTYYFTFKSMLQDFKKWSDAHPDHLPIYLLIECKEETLADKIKKLHFTNSVKFTPEISDDLDKEVKAVFGDSLKNVITPDNVRGQYSTLNEAVLAGNFPTIAAARGKFIFIVMDANNSYAANHSSLQGRTMFVFSSPEKPECAFVKYDDPSDKGISDVLKKGYIVRTRADSPNSQNRSGNCVQQQTAFDCGAQIISTDYYRPDNRYKKRKRKFTNYCTRLSDYNMRVNPVTATDKLSIEIKK